MALSDPGGILASPFIIIDRKDEMQVLEDIIDIINQHQVEQIVVGLPLSMDSRIGEQAEKVAAFIQTLRSRTEVPLEFRDERLTTMQAKLLIQAARTKKTKRKIRDDAIAAALILQGYLDETRL